MNISKVSEHFGMSTDTLRYYEKIGLIPSVPRTLNGIRNYDETSCKWIDFIKCMRGAGLPIEVLTRYVALFQLGDATIHERKALLERQRDVLAIEINEKQQVLDKLNNKIKVYEKTILGKEQELQSTI